MKKKFALPLALCSLLTISLNAMDDKNTKKMHDTVPVLSPSASQTFITNILQFKQDPIKFHQESMDKMHATYKTVALLEASNSCDDAQMMPITPAHALETNLNFLWAGLNFLSLAENEPHYLDASEHAFNKIICTEITSFIYQEKNTALQRIEEMKKKMNDTTIKTK